MKWFENKWANFTPLILLFILFGLYVLAQLGFVQCEKGFAGCTAIKPEYIFSTLLESKESQEYKLTQPVERSDKLTEDEIKKEAQTRKTIADRYNGRLTAMFLILANLLFCFIAFFIYFFLIKKSLDYKFAAGFIAVSLAVGIVLSLVDPMPLMKSVIDKTIAEKFIGGMPGIENIIRAVNALAYTATLAFVFTLCAVLYSGNSAKNKDKAGNENSEPSSETEQPEQRQIALDKKLQDVTNKKGDLETALYISTLLLIVGVLRANAMGNWSLTFMTPETVKIAESFLTHMTTLLGGFFTLLLTITYIPTIYIVQQREKLLLDNAVRDGIKTAEPFEKKDFTFSLQEALPRIIAIIAPFLTGPIAELFNNLLLKQI